MTHEASLLAKRRAFLDRWLEQHKRLQLEFDPEDCESRYLVVTTVEYDGQPDEVETFFYDDLEGCRETVEYHVLEPARGGYCHLAEVWDLDQEREVPWTTEQRVLWKEEPSPQSEVRNQPMTTKLPEPYMLAQQAREQGDLLRAALWDFISTIEATGGVVEDRCGNVAPDADQDWLDLGEAYLTACQALAREPVVEKIDEDLEDSPRSEEPAP